MSATAARRVTAPRARGGAPAATEEAVHRQIAALLTWAASPGVVWWHTPNGEARSKAGAGRLKAMGTRAGMPDLMLLRGGLLYALEIKAAAGRVSPAQAEVHRALADAGAEVWVAFGYDDAAGWLRARGLVRGA